ncbi:hypothetical protein PIB30_071874 [Stylosanthes scabra]|uniref:Secreted protein n=1 Tax=Stylosanthes scabra TaxID=79078 RepID=A0ABU6TNN9_9FABA|nr:hypothetical protein [Stylosanthes scabra]
MFGFILFFGSSFSFDGLLSIESEERKNSGGARWCRGRCKAAWRMSLALQGEDVVIDVGTALDARTSSLLLRGGVRLCLKDLQQASSP